MSGVRVIQAGAILVDDRINVTRYRAIGGVISIGNQQFFDRVIEQIRLMVGGHEDGDLSEHDLKAFEAPAGPKLLGPGLE